MDTRVLLPHDPAPPPAPSAAAETRPRAPERETTGNNGQPSWVRGQLPPQYAEIADKIEALKAEARKFEDLSDVLWQTGKPLLAAVRNLFGALKFETELTEGDASCDLRVKLDGGRRLLVQVVGTAEAIQRKTPQIGRILHALQDDAGPNDRVVMVANAFSDLAPDARRQEPVTPDALRLIQGLGANFVTAPTLFGIWRYSLTDLPGAKKSVMRLHEQDGGVFR